MATTKLSQLDIRLDTNIDPSSEPFGSGSGFDELQEPFFGQRRNCRSAQRSLSINKRQSRPSRFTFLKPAVVAPLAARFKHCLPDLPYEYNALEPHICGKIMELHHCKHHAAYVNKLNVFEEKMAEALAKNDITTAISLQPALKFNGGGHINHSLFWEMLSPCGGQPCGDLLARINCNFGTHEKMMTELGTAAFQLQGSGWAWLGYNCITKRLQIATTANQDPLQATTGLVPVLGIDVWEHAYYLQYHNLRKDYLQAFDKIINWKKVAELFEAAKACSSC